MFDSLELRSSPSLRDVAGNTDGRGRPKAARQSNDGPALDQGLDRWMKEELSPHGPKQDKAARDLRAENLKRQAAHMARIGRPARVS
jgi:hypothetical protein